MSTQNTVKFNNVPFSIYTSKNNDGKTQRRVFITVEDLATVPEEMFAVKRSQSQKPELNDKVVFKYLSYKLNDETPYSPLAPSDATLDTPLATLKDAVVNKLGAMAGVKFSIAINVPGSFANIRTADGDRTIFDNKNFPNDTNPNRYEGDPGYYVKAGARATITLTPAPNSYKPGTYYYRVTFETDASADDVFQAYSQAKAWTPGESSGSAITHVDTPAADDDAAGAIW